MSPIWHRGAGRRASSAPAASAKRVPRSRSRAECLAIFPTACGSSNLLRSTIPNWSRMRSPRRWACKNRRARRCSIRCLRISARSRLLIVLDNCEHVIDQTRRVVGSLLRECPKVRFLTTSREALTIMGERVYRIPPLAVPARKDISPEEALEYGAVALFVDRVRAADARFQYRTENVGADRRDLPASRRTAAGTRTCSGASERALRAANRRAARPHLRSAVARRSTRCCRATRRCAR